MRMNCNSKARFGSAVKFKPYACPALRRVAERRSGMPRLEGEAYFTRCS